MNNTPYFSRRDLREQDRRYSVPQCGCGADLTKVDWVRRKGELICFPCFEKLTGKAEVQGEGER